MASRAGLLVGAVGLTLAFAACSLINDYQPVPGQDGGAGGAGGGGVVCMSVADCDDANECTEDACTAGSCTHAAVAVGTTCSAGTGTGSCDEDGMCAVTCSMPDDPVCDDGNVCTVDVCNLLTGVCDRELLDNVAPPGMTNVDGDCVAITCVAGVLQVIDALTDVPEDGNDCTEDTCVPGSNGESAMPQNSNSPVDAPCGANGDLLCDGMGSCQNCNSNDDCGVDSTCLAWTCTNSTCVQNAQTGSACDDGNLCNGTDTCGNTGQCSVHTNAVVCTALDQCHNAGTCNAATGICSNPNKSNGSGCNDGNACTQTDTCQGGTCSGANPKVCTALDQCHNAGTCNTATGACSNPNKTNGTSCNDGQFCTQTDTCQGGTCQGAGNPCPGPDGDFDCSETCNESSNTCTANDPNYSPCSGNPVFCCVSGFCQSSQPCPL